MSDNMLRIAQRHGLHMNMVQAWLTEATDEEVAQVAAACRHVVLRRTATWTTSDGRVYFIKDMADDHLLNSYNKIIRDWPEFRPGCRRMLRDELRWRGIDVKG